MSWLRIDDGFSRHPKIAALTDRELRVWLRTLCYCAEYRTRGALPSGAFHEVTGLTNQTAHRYLKLRLLDAEPDPLIEGQGRPDAVAYVHDWAKYNPDDATAATRQARYRERKRNADSNAESNAHVTDVTVTPPVTVTVPRARARAPVPVPLSTSAAAEGLGGDHAAALRKRLKSLKWTKLQIDEGLEEPARAEAWALKAERHASHNPGGYAWAGFNSDEWPSTEDQIQTKRPLIEGMRSFVQTAGWQYTNEGILDEISVHERKRGETLSDDDKTSLLALAAEIRSKAAGEAA